MVMAAELIPHKGRLLPERIHSCVAGMRRLREIAPGRARALRDGLNNLSTELQQVGIHARDLDNRPGLSATARACVLLASSFLLRWLIWAAWLPVIVPAQVISRRNAPADKVVTFTIMGASFVSPLWLLGSALWLGSKYGASASLVTGLGLLLAAFCAAPVHDIFLRNLATLRARFEGGARGERNLRLLALRDHLKRTLTRRSKAFERLNLKQDSPA